MALSPRGNSTLNSVTSHHGALLNGVTQGSGEELSLQLIQEQKPPILSLLLYKKLVLTKFLSFFGTKNVLGGGSTSGTY